MAEEFQRVPITQLVPNKLNPRKDMGDVTGIMNSIISQGVIQPLKVRPFDDNLYEIIAGERRFTAVNKAIKAGKLPEDYEVPIIIGEIDDATAVKEMFIENLQREGLSDYEQAAGFKDFLDKFPDDSKAIDNLAVETGLNVQYIRRRARVMELPESVLNMWKESKLIYGHMEQLLRVVDDQVEEVAQMAVNDRMSVSRLKEVIEGQKAVLSEALFDIKEAGCNKCPFSTKVQKSLFGDDFKAERVMCTNSKCYYGKQTTWLNESWKNLEDVKKNKTNGIVISDNWSETSPMYKSTVEACKKCENFVTQVRPDGSTYHNRACNGDTKCFKANYESITPANTQQTTEEIAAAKTEKRAENIGRDCTEQFYKDNLPVKIAESTDALAIARIALMTMIKGDDRAFQRVMNLNGVEGESWQFKTGFLDSVLTMEKETVDGWIRDIAIGAVMGASFGLDERNKIARMFDLHLERDYVMDEFYLKKKSKAQLIDLSVKHNIIKSHTVSELGGMKKTDIITLLLEKDLAGIIPVEIEAMAASEVIETTE